MVYLHRKAIEATYTDRCTVTDLTPYKRANGSTGQRKQAVWRDLPCRLSYQSVPAAGGEGNTAAITQAIKLFLSPDHPISAGAVITVTHDGVTQKYRRAGIPAVYATHQEVPLMIEKERA